MYNTYDRVWFSSDWHLFDNNILKYCIDTRGHYVDIEEMNKDIITKINNKVSKNDIIFFLGDLSYCKKKSFNNVVDIIKRINCNIFFIKGNHDHDILMSKISLLPNVVGIEDIYSIKINDQDAVHKKQMIVMCHYPLEVWEKSHYGSWMIHGHCHGTLPINMNRMRLDIGIDCNNMLIFSYKDIKLQMFNRKNISIDGHV